MFTTLRNKSLFLAAVAAFSLFGATISAPTALADSTWISNPTLNSISLTGPGISKTNNGWSVSTQATDFTLTYKGSAGDAGKFAQVNLFELSSGMSIAFNSTPQASPSGCEQQVLAGDSHSCMFKLDGAGGAGIHVTLSGTSLASSFKFILLSGPNIAQTSPATVTFSAPKSAVKPLVATVKAMAGGAAALRFKLLDAGKPAAGVKVSIAFTGIGDNLSSTSAVSDSSGLVWVYLANLKAKHGSSKVTVTVLGTSTKGSASVKWLTGKLQG